METLTLDNILNLISVAAVIASVIYLAAQVRQSNKLQQSNILMESTVNYTNSMMMVGESPELREKFMDGILDYGNLSPEKQYETAMVVIPLMKVFENMFIQHKNQSFDDEGWEGYKNMFLKVMEAPGSKFILEFRKDYFAPSFIKFIKENLPEEISDSLYKKLNERRQGSKTEE